MASKFVATFKSEVSNILNLTEGQILQQISATHAPDGSQLDVKSLLSVTSNILNRSTQTVDGIVAGTQAHLENVEDKPFVADFEPPTRTIDKISCEIMCNCKASGMVNLHDSAISIFRKLSGYSWETKAVVAMAAFAVNYGDFWLVADIQTSNPVAKPIAILKKLPNLMKPTPALKNRLNALNSLTKIMLEVTGCIVEIEKLSVKHNAKDVPTLAKALADLPISVYWTLKSVVACAVQISTLTTTTDETQLTAELTNLTPKLTMTLSKLKDNIVDCKKSIEENKRYQRLLKLLVTHTDNVEFLKALISAKDDLLIDLSTKTTVKLDHLRRKNVILLISGLDITEEDLRIVNETYNSCKTQPQPTETGSLQLHILYIGGGPSHESQYELVWIPIVEQWTEEVQEKFESLRAKMSWYTVNELVVVNNVVHKFFKVEWHYQNKLIAVVLNSQGKVECEDAMHMIKIWRNKAFPFTNDKENELWYSQKWGLDFLLEGLHPQLQTWIEHNTYVLLYGGDDIAWVQTLEGAAKEVVGVTGMSVEFVSIGKTSNDNGLIQRFWSRIESMVFSMFLNGHEKLDEMSQEIQKLFGYKKEGKWAVLCRGSKVIMSCEGKTFMDVLSYEDLNKIITDLNGDLQAALERILSEVTVTDSGCSHFRYPTTDVKVPVSLKCPKCPRMMERNITFQCCHKDEGWLILLNGPN